MPRLRQEVEFENDIEHVIENRPRPRKVRLEVLHEDDAVIVLNKPPAVYLAQSPDKQPSVVELLIAHGLLDEEAGYGAAFPLDPPISGAVVIARSADAARLLERQVAEGQVNVTCLALVRGPVMQDAGEIRVKISTIGTSTGARMKIDPKTGRDAVTQWTVRDRFIGYALLECHTQPAVPHQIRVHLESAGLPLAVDPLYSGADNLMLSSFKSGYRPSRRHPERPLLDRVSLHVQAVAFRHPTTNQPLSFDAPLPKDFRAAIHQLSRFGHLPR